MLGVGCRGIAWNLEKQVTSSVSYDAWYLAQVRSGWRTGSLRFHSNVQRTKYMFIPSSYPCSSAVNVCYCGVEPLSPSFIHSQWGRSMHVSRVRSANRSPRVIAPHRVIAPRRLVIDPGRVIAPCRAIGARRVERTTGDVHLLLIPTDRRAHRRPNNRLTRTTGSALRSKSVEI
jgi:hypothetical protein